MEPMLTEVVTEDDAVVIIPEPTCISIALPNRFSKQDWTKRLDEARRKNEYCDLILKTVNPSSDNVNDVNAETEPVYGHKIILKLASTYFNKLLSTVDTQQKNFVINDIERPVLDILISCIYTCRLENVSEENMFSIYAGAKLLDLDDAQLACERFINKNRKIDNCIKILNFGRLHSCPSLSNPKYVLENLPEVSQTPAFPLLPTETLQLLTLSPDRAKYCSVNDLLSSFLLWVRGDSDTRMEDFLVLVKQLPRSELDEEMMERVFLEDELVKLNSSCQTFFHEYLVEFFREHKKSRNEGKKESPRKGRPKATPVVKLEIDDDDELSDGMMEKGRQNGQNGRDGRTRNGSHSSEKRHLRRPLPPSASRGGTRGKRAKQYHDHSNGSVKLDHKEISSYKKKAVSSSRLEPPFGDPESSCVMYFISSEKSHWCIKSFDLQTGECKTEASCVRRSNCGMVYNNDSIYIIGGIIFSDGEEQEGSDTLVFDLTSPPTWREDSAVPAMYKPRCDFQCEVWNNSIYAIGGSRSDMIVNNLLHLSCDDVSVGWEKLPGMRCMKSNSAGAVVDGKIYSIGGLIAEDDAGAAIASDLVECFDLESEDKWYDLARMPTPRLGHAVVALGQKLYVLGGGTHPGSLISKKDIVEVYDIETDTWTTVQPMNKKRQFFSAVAFNGLIFAFGGNSTKFPSAEMYDPAIDEWTMIDAALPLDGMYGSVAFKNDEGFVTAELSDSVE